MADSKRAPQAVLFDLVPASRLELLRLVATTPSRWRVYQFHHFGNEVIFLSLSFAHVNSKLSKQAIFLELPVLVEPVEQVVLAKVYLGLVAA